MVDLNPMDERNLVCSGLEVAEGLEPKRQPDQLAEGGGDDDVNRSLDKVAHHEAWLAANPTNDCINLATLTEELDALQSMPFGALGDDRASQAASNAIKTLVALDTRIQNWQEVAESLPNNADLLLLDSHQDGIDQINSSLKEATRQGSSYSAVALLGHQSGEGTLTLGSQTIEREQQNQALEQISEQLHAGNPDARLQLFTTSATEPEQQAALQATTEDTASDVVIKGDASSLLRNARQIFNESNKQGELKQALQTNFASKNYDDIEDRVKAFLNGKQQPKVAWASFEDDAIQGAFIASSNTILISTDLRDNSGQRNAVLLEEIGHWLEAGQTIDSAGDEGERFSKQLLGKSQPWQDQGPNSALLNINGDVVLAELSSDEVTAAESVDSETASETETASATTEDSDYTVPSGDTEDPDYTVPGGDTEDPDYTVPEDDTSSSSDETTTTTTGSANNAPVITTTEPQDASLLSSEQIKVQGDKS